jgi:hypothetical protein
MVHGWRDSVTWERRVLKLRRRQGLDSCARRDSTKMRGGVRVARWRRAAALGRLVSLET